ncbi:MAG: ligase-associated DNA damage response endonuclease PdeM [Parvularculaceae bacterium]|nr:ligase-associated DNA damage response endonuclease PdeM [Parvularculaceae bacterium]
MTPQTEITVNLERLIALANGALYWPAREMLIVADLHFEKGSHFAMKGVLLPPYDTRVTLTRLAATIREIKPASVVSLGDAFHDGGSEARIGAADAALLEQIVSSVRWTWILGNHDPAPPSRFGGAVEGALLCGRLLFRHEAAAWFERGEISGHFHPVARVRAETRLIRRRCFATDGERLVMPAFGAYAGGLNILDAAFDGVFRNDLTAWMIGRSGIYPFAADRLLGDSRSSRRKTG